MKTVFLLIIAAGLPISGCVGSGRIRAGQQNYQLVGTQNYVESFRDARAVAADDAGLIYVVDAAASEVRILSPSGITVATLGGSGTNEEGLFTPVDVDPTNGLAIYVADRDGGTIHRYTGEYRAAEVFAVPDITTFVPGLSGAARTRPTAVLAGPGGVLFVADAARGTVLLLNARRQIERVIGPSGVAALARPVGLALERSTGNLIVADGATGVLRIFDPFGTPLRSVQASDIDDLLNISGAGDRGTLVVGSAGIALMEDGGVPILVHPWTDGDPLVDAQLVGSTLWTLTAHELQVVLLPSK